MTIKFYVSWNGEMAAGIRPGYEEVEITLRYTTEATVDLEDVIDFWRQSLKDLYDGATVLTEKENQEYLAKMEAMEPKLDVEEI